MNRHVPAPAVALLLTACGAAEPAPPPPPPPLTPAPIVETAGGPAAPAAPMKRKAHQVQFVVKNADLATEVLPLFQEQVGISISWLGEPRRVTLRLTNPTDWEDALSLVCQWTKTHPTRDWQGKVVLKDGWGGDLGDGDIRALEDSGKVAPSGSKRGAGRGRS